MIGKRSTKGRTEKKQDQDNAKKDRMKKLHPLVKNMIMVTSAMDGDFIPTELVPSCQFFYNCKNAGLIDQELLQQFRALGLHEATYVHGVVQSLLSGHLLYPVGGSHNNISSFYFNE